MRDFISSKVFYFGVKIEIYPVSLSVNDHAGAKGY